MIDAHLGKRPFPFADSGQVQFATGTGSPLHLVPTVVRMPAARYVGGRKILGLKFKPGFPQLEPR
jgi:hypothetical protein